MISFLSNQNSYTKTEKNIINYIYQNTNTFLSSSISQLAKILNVSEATISRFAKHAGYRDYKGLRAAVAASLETASPAVKMAESIEGAKESDIHSFLSTQMQYIGKTMHLLDQKDLKRAVEQIVNAPHIYIHGKGAAYSLAHLLSFRLKRFGKQVFLLPSGGTELFEDLVHIPKDSLVIVFGFQKLPREVKVLLTHGKQAGYHTILFSSRFYTEEDLSADLNLFVYRGEPEEYHSMTASMAVIDAIVVQTAARMEQSAVKELDQLTRLKKQYEEELPG